ncbi:MAG TPA: FecR family protein, partial [Polyangia bacterium]|nr:FecR family protein [Polyangia bacterium]
MKHVFAPEPTSGAGMAPALWQQLAASQDTALAAEPGAVGPERVARDGRTLTSRYQLGRPRPRLRAWPIAVGAATAVAAVFLVVSVVSHRPALRVQIASDPGDVSRPPATITGGSSLIASARKDLPLQFSDGSVVTFRAGSSGRMLRLDAAGADVLLEHGTLQAHVVHAERTAWQLHAGPYRVRVTGTRFGLSWRSDKLELALYEGSVIVDGDVLGAGVPVTTGHRLTVASGIVRIEPLAEGSSPGSAHALTDRGPASDALALNAPERATGRAADHDQARLDRELDAEDSAAPSHASEQADSDRPSRHRHRRHKVRGGRGKTALADAGSSGASDDAWLDLADRGAYPEALAAAQRIGWSSLCLRLDAHRLLTLADVARYSN